MTGFKKTSLRIIKEQRGLVVLIVLNVLMGLFFFVYSVLTLKDSGVVGYGDIGGYRNGDIKDLLTYPILAVLLGILSVFLAMRIFERHGGNSAKVFISVNMCLIVWAFVTLLRLLGEG